MELFVSEVSNAYAVPMVGTIAPEIIQAERIIAIFFFIYTLLFTKFYILYNLYHSMPITLKSTIYK